MVTFTQKIDIYHQYADLGETKASLARKYGCSPRSIGRYIDEALEHLCKLENQEEEEVWTFSGRGKLSGRGVQFKVGDIKKTLEGIFEVLDTTYNFIGVDYDGEVYGYECRPSGGKVLDDLGGARATLIGVIESSNGQIESSKLYHVFPEPVVSRKEVEQVIPDVINHGIEEEEEYDVVITNDSLTISNWEDSNTITKDHPRFKELVQAVITSDMNQEVLAQVASQMSVKAFFKHYSDGDVEVNLDSQTLTYKGMEIGGSVACRVMDSMSAGEDTYKRLVKFINRLMANPSNRAVKELYGFLEATDIEIDDEGMVICFKKVRSNYMDIYSGTFDNSPGQVAEVSRNMVDEDFNRTCSYGLHVCSKSYLPHFSSRSGSDRIVKVKVDPADFVAVPADYNNAKARVCKYEVLEDVTNQF